MSAELCLHGADVWIKTLECQPRNFPGNCITQPPDMRNLRAGRHFPPFSILGTCTSKGKIKNKIKAKMMTTEITQLQKKKSSKWTKKCCIQQEKCDRRESEGSVSQGVADELQSDNISNISLQHKVKYNTYLICLTLTPSEAINISLQNHFPVSRDLLKPKSQFTHFWSIKNSSASQWNLDPTAQLPDSVYRKKPQKISYRCFIH